MDDATLFVSGSPERQLLVALTKAIYGLLHPELEYLAALQDLLRSTPDEIARILDDYELPSIEPADESQAIFEDEPQTQESDSSEEDKNHERADYHEDEMPRHTRDEIPTDVGDSGARSEESREPLPPGVRRSAPRPTLRPMGLGPRSGI